MAFSPSGVYVFEDPNADGNYSDAVESARIPKTISQFLVQDDKIIVSYAKEHAGLNTILGTVEVWTDPNADGMWSDYQVVSELNHPEMIYSSNRAFGMEMAASSNTLVLGTDGRSFVDDDTGEEIERSGGALVFVDPNQDGDWSDMEFGSELLPANASRRRHCGASVGVYQDTQIFVGCLNGGANSKTPSGLNGVVYAFADTIQDGQWQNPQITNEFTGGDSDELDYFGSAIAISGDTLFVGASAEDTPSADAAGAVYFFEIAE